MMGKTAIPVSALAPPVRGEAVERRRGSVLLAFLRDVLDEVTTGAPLTNCGWRYLPLVMLRGGYAYSVQLRGGLDVTAMSNHVTRGLHLACAMLFVVVLTDKGIGTIIPGFVPEPWGRFPPTRQPGWS